MYMCCKFFILAHDRPRVFGLFETWKMSNTEELGRLLKEMQETQKSMQDTQKETQRQLTQLQRDFAVGQTEATKKVVQKLEEEKTATFRKKGNEIQFRFNRLLDNRFENALEELKKIPVSEESGSDAVDAAVTAARVELTEGRVDIASRQKRIRIADRSEYGWTTVELYEHDELASDSADEKKLEKAEKEAEKRVAKRKREKMSKRFKASSPERKKSGSVDPQQHSSRRVQSTGPPRGGMTRMIGPCHKCGEMGHLVATCPQNRPTNWYPFEGYKGKGKDIHQGVVNNPMREELDPQEGDLRLGLDGQDGLPNNDDLEALQDWEGQERGEIVGTGSNVEQITQVKGRLEQNVQFWKEDLQASPFVISCIEEGYKLPLLHEPPQYNDVNQRSTKTHEGFVTEAVRELLTHGCVAQVETIPYICSPLSVVVGPGGKKRLVINLRYLNQFLRKDQFKYEDIRIAMQMFKTGDFLFKFDLKSGYHHVSIYKSHWKYLGFAWNVGGEGPKYYVFTVLPFGLATACYVFTKIVRPLVRYWRGQGIRAVVYLDDGIVAVEGREAASRASEKVREDLSKAGFVAHAEKSHWEPTRNIVWLGFELDLEEGKVKVPKEKLMCLQEMMEGVKVEEKIPAKTLASLIGKIMALSIAVGPVARLMTRSLYTVLNSRTSWFQKLNVSQEAREEIAFWKEGLPRLQGQNIWQSPSAIRVVYSDASGTGYAGYTVEHGPAIAHGQWSAWEAEQSSTWRELRAVGQVLRSLAHKLSGERIRWFTDNQNVVNILMYGSKKPLLQKESLEIFQIGVVHQIKLEPEWIPREENQLADYWSKVIDYDDWMVHPAVFAQLDLIWGPHTVDRFSNGYNRQVFRFNSRFWEPDTEGVDSFTCDWQGEINWWCPPVNLVPRVIQHAHRTRAKGTLIVPEWPSAPFWPVLFPGNGETAEFVVEMCQLPKTDCLLIPGRSGSNLFSGTPNTNVLAVFLDFGVDSMDTSTCK